MFGTCFSSPEAIATDAPIQIILYSELFLKDKKQASLVLVWVK